MKKKQLLVTTTILIAIATAIVYRLYIPVRDGQKPRQDEMEARNYLPGFAFVLDGETNVIKRAWSHRAFVKQNTMMPYLMAMTPHLQRYHWTRDRPPIQVEDQGDVVIVTIPVWPPPPDDPIAVVWLGHDYTAKATFDKESKSLISYWRGG